MQSDQRGPAFGVLVEALEVTEDEDDVVRVGAFVAVAVRHEVGCRVGIRVVATRVTRATGTIWAGSALTRVPL